MYPPPLLFLLAWILCLLGSHHGKGRGVGGWTGCGLGVVKKRKDGSVQEGEAWDTDKEQQPACGGGDAQAILQPVLLFFLCQKKAYWVASALLWGPLQCLTGKHRARRQGYLGLVGSLYLARFRAVASVCLTCAGGGALSVLHHARCPFHAALPSSMFVLVCVCFLSRVLCRCFFP